MTPLLMPSFTHQGLYYTKRSGIPSTYVSTYVQALSITPPLHSPNHVLLLDHSPSYATPPLHSPSHVLPLDHTPSYATLPLHSPAPRHVLHRATLHTLCCSTAPLSTPRLYTTHDVASDTPRL
ncbi:hypothetical protein Pcinc_008634 [Petrolisthes cinctipes]|uniref:Uncharacterized protein n=1 Tax=Petrolisthes cinctipes TaxID=88211 RepID=A0AAE1G8W3_PETCI|nr:hypothetical protein Pcinc_008634 [Petrolisthes cinctipes]